MPSVFRTFRAGLVVLLALATLYCGNGASTQSAGGSDAIATAEGAEALIEAGLSTAAQQIVQSATDQTQVLGGESVASLAVDGSNLKNTHACEGGGSFSLLLSESLVEHSPLGAVYHLDGLAYFSDCGPSVLTGIVKVQVAIGPIPAFCLARACPGGLPVSFTLAPVAEGPLTIDGVTVNLLAAFFEDYSAGRGFDGSYQSGEATVGPWFCTIAPDGVHCAKPAADTDKDGLPDDSDNCPTVPNEHQTDDDGDAIGDVCDNCLGTANVDQANVDGDPDGDACDPCPELKDILDCNQSPDNVCDLAPPPLNGTCSVDADCIPGPGAIAAYCGPEGTCFDLLAGEDCNLEAMCKPTSQGIDCPQVVDKKETCGTGRCCYETVVCALEFDGCESGTNAGCEEGAVCGPQTGGDPACECFPSEPPPPPPPPPELQAALDVPPPVEPPPVVGCTDCVCGNCLLEKGEACEPNALPGGSGSCPEGTTCADCGGCVPDETPVDDPCTELGSVSCDTETGLIRTDGLPEGFAESLGPSPVCDSLFLGSCAALEGGIACCDAGACGTLNEQLEDQPACGLLEVILNAQNPEDPMTGDQYCDAIFEGTCDPDGCCQPNEPPPPPPPPPPGGCGDASCDIGEDCESCELDCGPCASPAPPPPL